MEDKLLKTIKYLREYGSSENDYKSRIVLAAPAYGAQNLLRAYMNGGNIGKIALDNSEKTTGIKSKITKAKLMKRVGWLQLLAMST